MSSDGDCSAGIPPDPEIAGIGIRISVYIQVILSFAPMVISIILFDLKRPINRKQMKSLINVQASLLILGISMSISAFIQSYTTSLTVYHSLIVLSLEWLITISSVTLALHMFSNAYALVMFDRKLLHGSDENPNDNQRSHAPFLFQVGVSTIQFILKDHWLFIKLSSMLLGPAIQMMFTSIFGLRLFTKLSSFDTDTPACTAITVQSFVGHDILAQSPSVKRFWTVAYALTIFPGINVYLVILALAVCTYVVLLAMPFILIAILFVRIFILSRLYRRVPSDVASEKSVKSESKESPEISDVPAEAPAQRPDNIEETPVPIARGQAWGSKIALSSYMISTLILDIMIIVSLELTIARNKVQPGDNVWTFGQMLSMLLLVPGIWGVIHDSRKAAEAYNESSKMQDQGKAEGPKDPEKSL